MSLAPVSDAPRTHWITERPGLGCSGNRSISLVEDLRVGLDPVVEERRSQPVDRRTTHAEMGVPPFVLVAGVAVPFVGDADATGEADRLVHDHHLAVGPMVRLRHLEPVQRSEPTDAHAGVLHHVDQLSVDRVRTPRVQEDANPHARSRALGERLGEPRSDLATPVDERQEVDRVLSLGDGFEHRREDLVAVAEDLDEVALRRGNAEDPFERATDLGRFGPGAPDGAGSRPGPRSRRGADRGGLATERRAEDPRTPGRRTRSVVVARGPRHARPRAARRSRPRTGGRSSSAWSTAAGPRTRRAVRRSDRTSS